MESSAMYKKATVVLDEAARARLWSPFVSDTMPSTPSGRDDDDDDELVDLVREFYDGAGDHGTHTYAEDAQERRAGWKDMLHATLADATADVVTRRICVEAELAYSQAVGHGRIKNRIVELLRDRGFDAGLCRSSGDRNSFPAGTHEYVDVITPSGPAPRYIVEINLASEFEIARPSTEYQELLGSLPAVLVARPEALNSVATVVCAAAAESIQGAGMHVPPWRRARHVQAKWSGTFERMTGGTRMEQQEGARRTAGGRQLPRMEMGCREMTLGRERLMGMRPLFRGL